MILSLKFSKYNTDYPELLKIGMNGATFVAFTLTVRQQVIKRVTDAERKLH